MSVTATNASNGPYTPNGSTTTFPFTFAALTGGEVQAVRRAANGVDTPLTGYTVTLTSSGGSVVFGTAPAAGDPIYILSNPSFQNQTNFENQGDFSPTDLNEGFDRAAIRDIMLKENFDVLEETVTDEVATLTNDLATVADEVDALAQSLINATGMVTALTKAAIALLPTSNGTALLSPEGSVWVWTTTNFSARYGQSLALADPNKLMHIAPSGDLTGASGAWVRAVGPDMWINAEWNGLTITGTAAANATAINGTITCALAIGHKGVRIPPKDYPCSALAQITGGPLVIYARGARLFGTYPTFSTGTAASDVTLVGGHFDETSGGLTTAAFDHSGTRIKMLGTRFTRANSGDPTYCGYFRSTSVDCEMEGVHTLYWNGFFIEGTNHKFSHNWHRGIGGTADDCYVLKAANCVTSGIQISDVTVIDYATGVGFGSEVGTGAADDPNFQYGIENVQIRGLTTFNVERPIFFKPGSISSVDYRNGYVRNVLIDGVTMTDLAGTAAQENIRFSCDRGSIAHKITVRGAKFNGRGATISGLSPYGVYFYWPSVGTQHGTIQDVEIDYEHNDLYDGVATDGSHPGKPYESIIYAEKQISANGTAARIGITVKGNGSANSGWRLTAGMDDAFILRTSSRLRNTCQNTSNGAGVLSNSRLRIEEGIEVISVGSSRKAIGSTVVSGVDLYSCKKTTVRFGTYAAGTGTGQVAIFIAPVDLYLSDLDLMTSNTVTQDDTNYTTLTFYAGGSNFLSVSTKVTGGVAMVANTPLRLNSAVFNVANAYIAKGSCLLISKVDTGTGAALNDVQVQLSYVPYGALS